MLRTDRGSNLAQRTNLPPASLITKRDYIIIYYTILSNL